MVSLNGFLELLRRLPPIRGESAAVRGIGPAEGGSLLELGQDILQQLGLTPKDFHHLSLRSSTHSLACCGHVESTDVNIFNVLIKNEPLEVLLRDHCVRRREDHHVRTLMVEDGTMTTLPDICSECGANRPGHFFETVLPDAPVLSIHFERHPRFEYYKGPVGPFPELLSLPAEIFEHHEAQSFSLMAILLYNPENPALSAPFSTVIRAGGSWWWHRWVAIGHPVTGHLVDTTWGGLNARSAAIELSWDDVQQLRDKVSQLHYKRL